MTTPPVAPAAGQLQRDESNQKPSPHALPVFFHVPYLHTELHMHARRLSSRPMGCQTAVRSVNWRQNPQPLQIAADLNM